MARQSLSILRVIFQCKYQAKTRSSLEGYISANTYLLQMKLSQHINIYIRTIVLNLYVCTFHRKPPVAINVTSIF